MNECIANKNIDSLILNFLNNFDKNITNNNIPKQTPLRVSTRSAVCKITHYVDIDKMAEIIYYNINKNIIQNENSDYPIIGLKYKNIDINLNKPKKKKNSKKKKGNNFYNQATLIIKPHSDIRPQNIKLFRNSSISMTGGKNKNDGLCAVIILLYELKKYPILFKNTEDRQLINYNNYRITLINTDYSIEFKIDRMKLYELLVKTYKMFVIYSPDIYSGVKIYFFWKNNYNVQDGICNCEDKCYNKKKLKCVEGSCKRVTIAVFQSGKIIITGANKINQTDDAYKRINTIIHDNYNELRRMTLQDFENMEDKNKPTKLCLKIKVKNQC
jgi:TATA-box binding protein (TBP) (component of TFIID and TFIIIB)